MFRVSHVARSDIVSRVTSWWVAEGFLCCCVPVPEASEMVALDHHPETSEVPPRIIHHEVCDGVCSWRCEIALRSDWKALVPTSVFAGICTP